MRHISSVKGNGTLKAVDEVVCLSAKNLVVQEPVLKNAVRGACRAPVLGRHLLSPWLLLPLHSEGTGAP